ncbi:hypothetical protein HDU85_006732 [Gaertneriomyces sp. JEL0708]|nr:hypothetical protein HDU85_006732 [Gaertneriomyces sp. JEL0708]
MRLRYASMSTNVSAKMTPIHPLRVVSNTVFTDLTRASATSPARYGYITIDQGRQALLLQDTDPILDRIAVAGVWVQNVSYDDWRTVHACIKTWLGAKVKRMECPRMVLWCVGQGWWEVDIRQEPEECATYVAETVVAHGTAAQMTVKIVAMSSSPLGTDSERATIDFAADVKANSGEGVCPDQGYDASTDTEIIMPARQSSESITPTDATVTQIDATPTCSLKVNAAEEAPPDAQNVILHRLDQLQQQLDVLLLTRVAPSSHHDASTNTSWAFSTSDQCTPPLNANAYEADAKELIARVVRHSEQSFIIR